MDKLHFRIIFGWYIDGKLDDTQINLMEERLQNDTQFAGDFERFKLERILSNALLHIGSFGSETSDSYVEEEKYKLESMIYLEGFMNIEQALSFQNRIQVNSQLKDIFDNIRIEKYIQNNLKNSFLQDFLNELEFNRALEEKIDKHYKEKLFRNSGEKNLQEKLDNIIKGLQKSFEDITKNQIVLSPKQHCRDRALILNDLEQIELESEIDFNNPKEVELYNNLINSIRKEKAMLRMDGLLIEIEEERYFKPGLSSSDKIPALPNIPYDQKAELKYLSKIYWFSARKPVKKIDLNILLYLTPVAISALALGIVYFCI